MAEKKAKDDAGEAEVQKKVDEENAQGFVGTEADPTPDHAYTVDGRIADEPTPETDEKAAAEARAAIRPQRPGGAPR